MQVPAWLKDELAHSAASADPPDTSDHSDVDAPSAAAAALHDSIASIHINKNLISGAASKCGFLTSIIVDMLAARFYTFSESYGFFCVSLQI